MCHGPARGAPQQKSDLARSLGAVRRRDMIFGREQQGSENKIGKGQHDVEIIKVAFVVQMVMGVQPAEPSGVFYAPSFRNMHAVMKIFVKAVVKRQRKGGAGKNFGIQNPLHPQNHRHMKADDKRRALPGRAYLADDLDIRRKILLSGAEQAAVNRRLGAERIAPDRHMHEMLVQRPFKEAGVNNETKESSNLA